MKRYWIERLQIEEGFLDDLDLVFAAGLNVLIGGRGTGKTSIIELLRFCLEAPAFTEEARDKGNQQALSVLGGGRVTVTLTDGDDRVSVTRSSTEEKPRATGPIPGITVLAQNEIEAVASKEEGRMHLIDRCRPDTPHIAKKATEASAALKARTAEIRTLLTDIDKTDEQIRTLSSVPEALKVALTRQEAVLKSVEATEADQKKLAQLQEAGAVLAVRSDIFNRSEQKLGNILRYLSDTSRDWFALEAWPESSGSDDLLKDMRGALSKTEELINQAAQILREELEKLSELRGGNEAQRAKVEDASRELRRRLEALEKGAGSTTREVNELREKAGQLEALQKIRKEQTSRLEGLIEDRRSHYDSLDSLRDERFASRKQIADRLTEELKPHIRVEVTRSARKQALITAVGSGLRGSGLHHSTLAPLLAEKLAPIEIVEAAEKGDGAAIADAAEITLDRAGAAANYLRHSDTPEIISARIEDSVSLFLLDGSEYKDSERMSIGQRCTVVLPILLSETADVLIVDQPEDHLDNAYITSTLVQALRSRESDSQVIISSHNANIPVLGNANRVVLLESDGQRGFVRHIGELDEPGTVKAVTSVMEGGIEAFRRRAEFYGEMQSSNE